MFSIHPKVPYYLQHSMISSWSNLQELSSIQNLFFPSVSVLSFPPSTYISSFSCLSCLSFPLFVFPSVSLKFLVFSLLRPSLYSSSAAIRVPLISSARSAAPGPHPVAYRGTRTSDVTCTAQPPRRMQLCPEPANPSLVSGVCMGPHHVLLQILEDSAGQHAEKTIRGWARHLDFVDWPIYNRLHVARPRGLSGKCTFTASGCRPGFPIFPKRDGDS